MLPGSRVLESPAFPGERDVTATATLPQLSFQRTPSEFRFGLCALNHDLFFLSTQSLVGVSCRASPLLGRGGDKMAELCLLGVCSLVDDVTLSHRENVTVSTRWNVIDDLRGTGRGERRGP